MISGMCSVAFGSRSGENAERLVTGGESRRHPLRQDNALPGLSRGRDDLVLDVGDVADVGHLVAAPHQIAANHIEGDGRSPVPDMRLALHRRPAQTYRDLALVPGLEGTTAR